MEKSFLRIIPSNYDDMEIPIIEDDSLKSTKLIPISDKQLIIKYQNIFNNYQEELNIIFNESYSYFKN